MKKSKAILVALLAFAFGAQAVPVSIENSRKAARAWAARGTVLGVSVGSDVERATALKTSGGQPFYVVKMSGGGTLLMSADDTVEPVLGFVPGDVDLSSIDPKSPLSALLARDLEARSRASRKKFAAAAGATVPVSSASRRWAELLAAAEKLPPEGAPVKKAVSPVAGIGDVRVAPLVQSAWGQSTVGLKNVYNYCTPNNYLCGCVATAMAQVMRYWRYPTEPVEAQTMTCKIRDDYVELTMQGGVYDWDLMPLVPDSVTTDAECAAIGKLTSDAGISVSMQYGYGGSGAIMYEVVDAMKDVFGYRSVEYVDDYVNFNIESNLFPNLMFANFDYGAPVLMGIIGYDGGHAIVGDGYGFDGDTAYTHLNMGWDGQENLWYIVPDMGDYQYFDELIFNVFPDVEGQVLSGRVLDPNGAPIVGATVMVTAAGSDEVITQTVTKAAGVYAFVLPADATYEVKAVNAATHVASEPLTAALPSELSPNSWGNNLVVDHPVSASIGSEEFRTLEEALAYGTNIVAAGGVVTIELMSDISFVNHLEPWTLNCGIEIVGNGYTVDASYPFLVSEGGVLTLDGVRFSGSGSTVSVVADGRLVLNGTDALTGITLRDGGALEFGPTFAGMSAPCAVDTDASAAGSVFATSSQAPAGLASALAAIYNANDETLFPTASAGASGSDIAWGAGETPVEIAAVRLDQGGASTYYVSVGSALRDVTGDAELVLLRDCTFTNAYTLVAGSTLVVKSESGAKLTPAATVPKAAAVGFTVPAGSTLVVDDVTFSGFTCSGSPLFSVEGAMTLADGAVLSGLVFSQAKALAGSSVYVKSGGVLTLEAGASIVNCTNLVSNGGAVCLATGAELDLFGGSITGCGVKTTTHGGAVYANKSAVIRLQGAGKVRGNSTGKHAVDDLSVADGASLVVMDALDGADLGVYVRATGGMTAGAVIAAADGALSAADAATAASAFFNDVTAGLSAGYSDADGTFVWVEGERLPEHQVEEGDPSAVAKVTVDGVTTWWNDLSAGIGSVTGGVSAVEVLGAATLRGQLTVAGEMTISGSATVTRALDAQLLVPADAKLTLEGVTFNGGTGRSKVPFVKSTGGAIYLGEGLVISGVRGTGSRDAGSAVVVSGDGTVVLAGATISGCDNDYVNKSEGTGVGAGILVDLGTAYLTNGVVTGCTAYKAAGVFIGNKAKIFVSGDVSITGNTAIDGADANLYVADWSGLTLTDPALAGIGYTTGVGGDTYQFGQVADEFSGSTDDLVNSAHAFVNDVTGSIGCVVTNETETLLVWIDAIDENGVYTDREGETYGYVDGGDIIQIAVPTAVEGLVYDGTEQTGVQQALGFTLVDNTATDAGDYVATATLRPGFAWDDGTSAPKTVDWSIAKGVYDLSGITFEDGSFVADGSAKSIFISGTLPDGVTVAYDGNEQTAIGVYTVTASFTGDTANYEPITATLTATLTLTEAAPDEPEVVHPLPIAFQSIEKSGENEWTLVVTNVVPFCNYRLLYTTDLAMDFTPVSDWVQMPATAPAAWTIIVTVTEDAFFWKAEAKDGEKPSDL